MAGDLRGLARIGTYRNLFFVFRRVRLDNGYVRIGIGVRGSGFGVWGSGKATAERVFVKERQI